MAASTASARRGAGHAKAEEELDRREEKWEDKKEVALGEREDTEYDGNIVGSDGGEAQDEQSKDGRRRAVEEKRKKGMGREIRFD